MANAGAIAPLGAALIAKAPCPEKSDPCASPDKDRKSNATSGGIFDSGSLSQSPISHQGVLGAAIKLPYRSPAPPVAGNGAAGGDLSGLQARVSSLTRGGSSCLILCWHLTGPAGRCADRTRSPVRSGLTNPTEDRYGPVPPLPPATAVARALGRCGVAGWIRRYLVEDLLHAAGIVDEGDDPHGGVANRATQWQGFIDARQQHGPQIPGNGSI